MLSRYWLYVLALGGLAGLAGFVVLPMGAEKYCKAPTANERPTATQQTPQNYAGEPNVFERIARSLETISQTQDPIDKTQREIGDLAAQQDMACWAFWMMAATAAQILVGIGGIIAVVITIRQGRRSLRIGMLGMRAARRSNQITERNSRLDLRAYLCVEAKRVKDKKTGLWKLEMRVRNQGKTAAYHMEVRIGRLLADTDEEMIRLTKAPIGTGGRTLLAGLQMFTREPIEEFDDQVIWNEFKRGKKVYFVWGRIDFADEFAERRWIEFQLKARGNNILDFETCGVGNRTSDEPRYQQA